MNQEEIKAVLAAIRYAQYWTDYTNTWVFSQCHYCEEEEDKPCDDDCEIAKSIELLEKELKHLKAREKSNSVLDGMDPTWGDL